MSSASRYRSLVENACLAAVLMLLWMAGDSAPRAEDGANCPGKVGHRGMVAEVIDGATLRLSSGEEVRLAGIEPPSAARLAFDRSAKEMLTELVKDRIVELRHSSAKVDRYGRSAAQLFLAEGSRDWVEAKLIGAGLSRVDMAQDNHDCLSNLLPIEQRAREAGLGMWGEAEFMVSRAEDPSLSARANRYALIEGRVVSVGERSAAIYLDLGRDWSTDFTAIIEPKNAKIFQVAGKGPADLSGRLVRVRGWLTKWNGAAVRLNHPDEIELLDETKGQGNRG